MRSHRVEMRARSDAGETLVETLIAVVIIGLAATALLGAMTTSITSSGEHRSLASDDVALRSFADAAEYDIQLSPSYEYANCATNYRVVAVSPTEGAVGTTLAVFGTDFTPGGSLTATLATSSPSYSTTITGFSSGSTVASGSDYRNGTADPTFVLPAMPAGSYSVTIADSGGDQGTATSSFTVVASLGALSAASGPAGSSVAVAASGFAPTAALQVKVGGTSATVTSGGTTGANGSSALSFVVPSSLTIGTSYPVVVSDGTNSASSSFTVAAAIGGGGIAAVTTVSSLAGYTLGISGIGWWNSRTGSFDPSTGSCSANDDSGTQEVTLESTAPNGVSNNLSFTVVDPVDAPPLPAPITALGVSPTAPTLGQSMTFTLTLTGGTIAPSGTVTWTFSGAPGSPTCANSTLAPSGNSSTATCIVGSVEAGLYDLTANYSGDTNYSPTSAYDTVTIDLTTPSDTVAALPANPTPGQSVTFTATVSGSPGGATPTGTVQWSFTSAPGTAPSCTTSSLSGTGNAATATCTVANTSVGTYQVTGAYSGDTNYQPASGNGSVIVAVKTTPTLSASGPSSGAAASTIAASSVSAALAGASTSPAASGSITFTVFGPQASAPSTCTTGGITVGGTTMVDGNGTYHPSAGYTPTVIGDYWWYASYGGDTYDNSAVSSCGSGMSETVVGLASPTLTASAPGTDTDGTVISTSAINAALSASSGSNATGTITVKVFGPQTTAPSTCAAGTTVGTATVGGNGTYNPSATFDPTTPGDYWWYASYGGDSNNNSANSPCGSTMTETIVSMATVTHASAGTYTLTVPAGITSVGFTLIGGGGAGAASGAGGAGGESEGMITITGGNPSGLNLTVVVGGAGSATGTGGASGSGCAVGGSGGTGANTGGGGGGASCVYSISTAPIVIAGGGGGGAGDANNGSGGAGGAGTGGATTNPGSSFASNGTLGSSPSGSYGLGGSVSTTGSAPSFTLALTGGTGGAAGGNPGTAGGTGTSSNSGGSGGAGVGGSGNLGGGGGGGGGGYASGGGGAGGAKKYPGNGGGGGGGYTGGQGGYSVSVTAITTGSAGQGGGGSASQLAGSGYASFTY